MVELKLIAKETGPHVRVTVFAGEAGFTLANTGSLMMGKAEFRKFAYALVLGSARAGEPVVSVINADRYEPTMEA